MLKNSIYNVVIDHKSEDELLLFNTITGSFGLVYGDAKKLYLDDEMINESILSDEEIKRNISIMKDNGFLVDEDVDELVLRKVISKINRYSSDQLGLTIAPTMNCNMACPYCYEDAKPSVMSEETKKSLINFVKEYSQKNKIKSLSITWYGGEPLLELESICGLSKSFISYCDENDIDYEGSIVTNGILLTQETAKTLKKECRVNFAQVTIDGLQETHNKRRVLKSGGDSYTKIIQNIDDIQDIMSISIRVNTDKTNVGETKRLVDFFINEKNWSDNVGFYFAPITNSTDACTYQKNKCYTNQEFGKINSELLEYMYKTGKEMNRYIVTPPRVSFNMCGFTTQHSYVVDPDGLLYKCWDVVGVKESNVGDIVNGPRFNKEHLKWLDYQLDEKCESCNVVSLCNGGCPFERMNNNKNECSFRTITYKTSLKLAYDRYSEQENHNEV